MTLSKRTGFAIAIIFNATLAAADGDHLPLEQSGDMLCMTSNDTPNHAIGQFPNRANPNAFRPQTLQFCFDAAPEQSGQIVDGLSTVGVTLTGIPIRPYTAGYYDPNGRRQLSDNPTSGWRQQAMHDPRSLGMDSENGHTDRSGLYHYHAMAPSYLGSIQGTHVGYAPDGFEIHYSPTTATSSWVLMTGERPTPPYGTYDGTYEEDWVYQSGTGTLDACNGGMINGTYTYFATDTYPYFPRCFVGNVNRDFMLRPR